MTEVATLANPIMREVGPTAGRELNRASAEPDARAMTIISADTHYEIRDDIFYDHFPAHLKDRAPRVWLDEFMRIGDPSDKAAAIQAVGQDASKGLLHRIITEHNGPGVYDLELRNRHREIDGVHKEIAFPQSVNGFFGHPDLEVREWMFRIYNEHLAKVQADNDGFFGVGICSNWWDPEKVRDSVLQIRDLGLKTFMLPISPGKYRSGKAIAWSDEQLEPLWATIEECDLPVCYHIQENISEIDGRGKYAAWLIGLLDPFRKPFAQLAFGGVFDRHPELKVVFAEAGIAWVPAALQDAEMLYDSFGSLLDPRPAQRPTHYWHKNCYATFQNDKLGLEMLKYIGVDNVMWGSDYPHTEGSAGYTQKSIQQVIDSTNSREEASKILGGNAARVFKL